MNWPLIFAVGIPELFGSLVGMSTKDDVLVWFKAIQKPAWTPPGPIFGIAWTILYAFMGYASWLVWLEGGWRAQAQPLTWYIVQLVLNLSWPLVFFKEKRLGLAEAVNLATLATAAIATSLFYPVNKLAGQLMLPYLAWLAFANLLNISILRKNDAGASAKMEDMRHQAGKENPGDSSYKPPAGASASLAEPARSARGRKLALSVACSTQGARQAAPSSGRVGLAARRVQPAARSSSTSVRLVSASRAAPVGVRL